MMKHETSSSGWEDIGDRKQFTSTHFRRPCFCPSPFALPPTRSDLPGHGDVQIVRKFNGKHYFIIVRHGPLSISKAPAEHTRTHIRHINMMKGTKSKVKGRQMGMLNHHQTDTSVDMRIYVVHKLTCRTVKMVTKAITKTEQIAAATSATNTTGDLIWSDLPSAAPSMSAASAV